MECGGPLHPVREILTAAPDRTFALMPLIKMAAAARRARMGSSNTISRALRAAGVPLVTVSPGVFAVEEQDLERFLRSRQEDPPPAAAPKRPRRPSPPESLANTPRTKKRRS